MLRLSHPISPIIVCLGSLCSAWKGGACGWCDPAVLRFAMSTSCRLTAPAASSLLSASRSSTARAFRTAAFKPCSRAAARPSHAAAASRRPAASLADGMLSGLRKAFGQVTCPCRPLRCSLCPRIDAPPPQLHLGAEQQFMHVP
jgi:hypothetical protein